MKFLKFILCLVVATTILSLSVVAETANDPMAELRQLEAAINALEATASNVDSTSSDPKIESQVAPISSKVATPKPISSDTTKMPVSATPPEAPSVTEKQSQKETATPPKIDKNKEKLTPVLTQKTERKENRQAKKKGSNVITKKRIEPPIEIDFTTTKTHTSRFDWISSTDLLFLIFLILICLKTPLITHYKSVAKTIQKYCTPGIKTLKTIPLNYIGLSVLIVLIILLINATQSPPKSVQQTAISASVVDTHHYKLIIGSFHSKENALAALKQFRRQGIDCFVKKSRNPTSSTQMPLYQIQAGAFKDLSTAKKMKRQLQSKHIDAYIKTMK